jgi:hypothetical protein
MVEERSKGTAEGCGHPVLIVRCHYLILKHLDEHLFHVGPESYVDLSINSPLHFSSLFLYLYSVERERDRRNKVFGMKVRHFYHLLSCLPLAPLKSYGIAPSHGI